MPKEQGLNKRKVLLDQSNAFLKEERYFAEVVKGKGKMTFADPSLSPQMILRTKVQGV